MALEDATMFEADPPAGREFRDGRRPPFAGRVALPVADGFDLDLVGRRLHHDGRLVHLRPREFDLLATLASNPGRAFTRGQLIALAWDSEGQIGPRTVDVHIHWLRAKIECQPREPIYLVTVRGFGYRLDPPWR
jgi:DNA-binding response OmpR family regulator